MGGERRIGVAGAGTMGSGIALAALLSDFPVALYDLSEAILERARGYLETHLARRGKVDNLQRLSLTTELPGLSGCDVVIEASPEDLALKQELFARLAEICPPPAILATNTSTLSVSAIGAASGGPQRVAGMHFFNPAAVIPLVEIVPGALTAADTLERLARLAREMGKTPVVARETPGFIVNRVARPFYGEALRLLGEGVAGHAQLDAIIRQGGGFRMGPFELMDLIGIDVNLAATQSIYEQTFHEPRFRPHPIQARMVAQNALGRKTGRGFYEYPPGAPREPEPPPPGASPPPAPLLITPGSWATGLARLLEENGLAARPSEAAAGGPAGACLVVAGRDEDLQAFLTGLDRALPPETPILCQCADTLLAEIASWVDRPERLAGFDGLFFAGGGIATLVATPWLGEEARRAIENLVIRLGRRPVWIQDTPALVLPRLVSALANEAAFAVGEGVADPATIDRAMQLGTNYPRGPLAWARNIGLDKVLAILRHLQSEYGEERYRPAPLLKRWLFAEKSKKPLDD